MTPSRVLEVIAGLNRLLEVRSPVLRSTPRRSILPRVGAALCDRRGNILSVGFNSLKTHPRAAMWHAKADRPYCSTIHAEMACTMAYPAKIPRGASVVVSRIKANVDIKGIGEQTKFVTGLSLPCPSCFVCLTEQGVARTFFTTDETSTYGELRI